MLELLREGHNSNLIIIRKPSNEASLAIHAHPNDWLIFEPELPSQVNSVSPGVDIPPESKPNKMLTVDIGVILNKGIADPNKHVIRNCVDLYLEVGLALLGETMLTVDYHKYIVLLYDVISLELVLLGVFGYWIGFELEHLAVLLAFIHKLFDPFCVVMGIFFVQPGYVDFAVKLFLDASF